MSSRCKGIKHFILKIELEFETINCDGNIFGSLFTVRPGHNMGFTRILTGSTRKLIIQF